METATVGGKGPLLVNYSTLWEESYRPLPYLFFGLFVVWIALGGMWTANTWSKRRWQTNKLQWVLTTVPVLKALVLGLSYGFWYSCLHLSSCSFWVAFGVFVARIFFETACFTTFLLISHGYCIIHEQLSLTERRSIAGLASLLYLILTGYKAAIPQFLFLVVVMYAVLLYVIFLHISQNLLILKEQMQYMQDEGVHVMQNAVSTKYSMFKKFQSAMFVIVAAEIMMHSRPDGVADEYWMRLVVREWTEIGIFVYIGWTFRSREMTPFFSVVPALHSSAQKTLPPIYSVEMNEMEFRSLDFNEWHIGMPTSGRKNSEAHRPVLVIVRNPGMPSPPNSKTNHGDSATPFKTPKIAPPSDGKSCSSDRRNWGVLSSAMYPVQARHKPDHPSRPNPPLNFLLSAFKPCTSAFPNISKSAEKSQLLHSEDVRLQSPAEFL